MSSGWHIRFTKQAKKDVDSLSPKLKQKLYDILINTIVNNPYTGKKLMGDLAGSYSFRLTHKDRLVYSLDEKERVIYIERAKTHYGD